MRAGSRDSKIGDFPIKRGEEKLSPTNEFSDAVDRLSLDTEGADLTKICWTQLLRQIPELVGPQRPFEALPDDFSPEKLFL